MRLKVIIFIFTVFMLVLFFFLLSNKTAGANHRVCVQNNCFNVSIADTPAERERGLMFVQSLKSDVGMLFIFEQSGLYPFWMKNTLIPLDIVWLDEDKKIVFIKNNALPCGADACPNIVPAAEARYVLEINAGTAERLQWKIGDVMYMD